MDGLYRNVGRKIKSAAKYSFIIGALYSIITGIIRMVVVAEFEIDDAAFISGLFTALLGPAVALLSSWLLYAFGEITEKISENEKNMKQSIKKPGGEFNIEPILMKQEIEEAPARGNWTCTCGLVHEPYVSDCVCGVSKQQAKAASRNAHKWICDGCGKMRTQTPCEHCGK